MGNERVHTGKSTPAKSARGAGKQSKTVRSADGKLVGRSPSKRVPEKRAVAGEGSQGPRRDPRGRGGDEARATTEQVARAAVAVTTLLAAAAPSEVESVTRLAAGDGEDLDPALWGESSSRLDAAGAAVSALRRQFARRHELERGSVTRAEAAELLGVSEQAVTGLLESRRLLGLRRGRRWLIPAWQFEADAERGVLPGVAEVAQVFPGGLVALSDWVGRPSPDLDEAPPRAVLARGDVSRVVRLAGALTAAGW